MNLERDLEKWFGVPFMVTFLRKPERLGPEPVKIFCNGRDEGTLEQLRPAHYANLRELADSAVAVHVMAYHAQKVEEYFRGKIAERLG